VRSVTTRNDTPVRTEPRSQLPGDDFFALSRSLTRLVASLRMFLMSANVVVSRLS